MPAGLQVWDASGNLITDTSTYLGRVVGSTTTGFTNGSVSVDLSDGTPFAYATIIVDGSGAPGGSGVYGAPGIRAYNPQVTATANSVTWSFPDQDTFPTPEGFEECIIYYGVY